MRTKTAALVLCSLSLAPAAWAHKDHGFDEPKAKATEMGKPAPEMEKMKSMLGTWSCSGTSTDHAKPTPREIKSTMKMTSELGGHWILADYSETKTKEQPTPFAFKELIGWDATAGKYQRLFVDNMGGSARMTAAPAVGGKMEWAGDAAMGGRMVPMKELVTMKSDKETLVEVTMQGPDGKWSPVVALTCKK